MRHLFRSWFLLAPDGGASSGASSATSAAASSASGSGGGNSAGSGAASSTPATETVAAIPQNDLPHETTPAVSPTSSTTPPATTVSGTSTTPLGTPPANADEGGFRSAAKGYGLDLSQYGDDHSALQALVARVQTAERLEQLAKYGQEYVKNADAFTQWQAEQRKQQAAPPKKFFELPEWKNEWNFFLKKDPTSGEMTLQPGAPPDMLQKYHAHEQYKRDWANKLLTDPEAALGPMIEQRAQTIAEKIVGGNLQGYQDRVYADNFVQQNSTWLHVRDANGQIQQDPISGQPRLSPEGERFRSYVVELNQNGITDIRVQQKLARQLLERDIALVKLEKAQASTTDNAQRTALLEQQNRATHQANAGGSQNGGSANASQQVAQNQQLSLEERLRVAMSQGGVTDKDFATIKG